MINIGKDGYDLDLRSYDSKVDVIVVDKDLGIVHNGNIIGFHKEEFDSNYDLYLWWGINSSISIDRTYDEGTVKVVNVDITE